MKKFVKTVLAVSTVFIVLLYFPNLFVYQISPRQFWPIGIVGIGFFYLFVGLLFCATGWLFFSKKISIVLFVLLIAGLPVLKNVFAFNRPGKFSVEKKDGSFRIMQWNCRGMPGITSYFPAEQVERLATIHFIEKYQPDIICLQDFSEIKGPDLLSNIALLRDSLHFPYYTFRSHYFSRKTWGDTWTGIAIFSRFPIQDTGCISYPEKNYPESILWADVSLNQKKIRISTTHLQSMHLSQDFYKAPLDTMQWQDSLVIIHGTKLEKLRHFQLYHTKQVATLKHFIDSCGEAMILATDLNSLPSSYVYGQVKGKLKDAFLEKGSGLGRTYHSRQPALRIDYLFHNDAINILQLDVFPNSLSDHDPVLMDFELK